MSAGCSSITPHYGIATYSFARPKGRKTVARHLVNNVDVWVSDENNPDLNKITVERQS